MSIVNLLPTLYDIHSTIGPVHFGKDNNKTGYSEYSHVLLTLTC